jgi:hypothetical protein
MNAVCEIKLGFFATPLSSDLTHIPKPGPNSGPDLPFGILQVKVVHTLQSIPFSLQQPCKETPNPSTLVSAPFFYCYSS